MHNYAYYQVHDHAIQGPGKIHSHAKTKLNYFLKFQMNIIRH